MPVVPIARSPRGSKAPQRQPPPEPWALMAAATMQSEGRLLPPVSSVPEPVSGQ